MTDLEIQARINAYFLASKEAHPPTFERFKRMNSIRLALLYTIQIEQNEQEWAQAIRARVVANTLAKD